MSNFKPQVSFITDESIRDYRNNQRRSQTVYNTYPTYRLLKKDLKDILKENVSEHVTVSRSKRGEWGEWFEHWVLSNGKPIIIKEGWM